MDLYFERHDGEAATVENFLKVFEDVSGRDLVAIRAVVPSGRNAEPDGDDLVQCTRPAEYVVEIEQSVPPTPSESRKRLMHIPLAFGLVGSDGSGHRLRPCRRRGGRERRHPCPQAPPCRALQRRRRSGHRCRSTAAFRRRSRSASSRPRKSARFLARQRQRPVLALAGLQLAAHRRADGRLAPVPRRQGSRNSRTSSPTWPARSPPTTTLEPAFRALALTLPGEADIARELGTNIDPDAIFAAREALAKAIAEANAALFEQLFDALGGDNTFSPDAASAGRRALRNVLLDYLSAGSGDPARASRQFAAATNMTDRSAALTILAQRHPDAAETAAGARRLRSSATRADPLVLDKWFQIQASIPGPPRSSASRR